MLKKRLPPKIILVIGGSIALVALFFSSYTESILGFLSLYGAFNGIGCGMMYMVPLVCGWEYFPKYKGLITGIIVGAYGFASFGFGLISTDLVNPDNANPVCEEGADICFFDPEVADRVPMMMHTLVYIWSVFVLLAILLITRKKEAPKLLQEPGENLQT
jgi:MFS transporter, OFA family, oxalate/formate antiporter